MQDNPRLSLEASVSSWMNYAYEQAGYRLIDSLCLFNQTDTRLEKLEIEFRFTPGFASQTEPLIVSLESKASLELTQLPILMDNSFLANVDERINAKVEIICRFESEEWVHGVFDVAVLAFNEWFGTQVLPILGARYIQPNHTAIPSILNQASILLKEWTKDPSIVGYQRDRERVHLTVGAIYGAMQKLNITYMMPPASYEVVGQKVRLIDEIMETRQGTCLDLALMMCACLEAARLNAILILLKGHAFVGVWLEDKCFLDAIQEDEAEVRKRIADGIGEIELIEATALCAGSDLSYDDAVKASTKSLFTMPFECALDVRRARLMGHLPLPQRRRNEAGVMEIIHEDRKPSELTERPEGLGEVYAPAEHTDAGPVDKFDLWQRKLLDLSKRNALVNLRITRSVLPILCGKIERIEDELQDGKEFQIVPMDSQWNLDITEDRIFEIFSQLSPHQDHLQEDLKNGIIRVPYKETELSKSILQIYRIAKTSIEENGANTLYLVLGTLKWYETRTTETPRYAPILLLPIEIIRKSARTGYVIRLRDDEPQLNVTLMEMLRQNYQLTIDGLDPLPLDDHGLDIRQILSRVRQGIMYMPRWDVVESAYIGHFSFAQFVMWNDMRARIDDLKKNKIVASLAAGHLTWSPDPIPELNELSGLVPVPADGYQLRAIQSAGAGRTFVLHGPPGTGKSQTITGMIANALMEGKSVLFVAEKMAALSVVKKRLEALGIGPFCLELHSNKAQKKDVLGQLSAALEMVTESGEVDAEAIVRKRESLYEVLSAHRSSLHKVHSFGYSLYQAIAQAEKYGSAPDGIKFEYKFIQSLSPDKIMALESTVEGLVSIVQRVGVVRSHPFYGSTLKSAPSHVRDRCLLSLQKAEEALSDYCGRAKRIAVESGSCLNPQQYSEIEQLASEIETVVNLEKEIFRMEQSCSERYSSEDDEKFQKLKILSDDLCQAYGCDRDKIVPMMRSKLKLRKAQSLIVAYEKELQETYGILKIESLKAFYQKGEAICLQTRIAVNQVKSLMDLVQNCHNWEQLCEEKQHMVDELDKLVHLHLIPSIHAAKLLEEWRKAEGKWFGGRWAGHRSVRNTLASVIKDVQASDEQVTRILEKIRDYQTILEKNNAAETVVPHTIRSKIELVDDFETCLTKLQNEIALSGKTVSTEKLWEHALEYASRLRKVELLTQDLTSKDSDLSKEEQAILKFVVESGEDEETAIQSWFERLKQYEDLYRALASKCEKCRELADHLPPHYRNVGEIVSDLHKEKLIPLLEQVLDDLSMKGAWEEVRRQWKNGDLDILSMMTHIQKWIAHLPELRDLCAWNEACEQAKASGLVPVTDAVNEGLDANLITSAFLRGLYTSMVETIFESDSECVHFNGQTFDARVSSYHRIDNDLRELSKKLLQHQLIANLAGCLDLAKSGKDSQLSTELGILHKAIRSRGRNVSIRKLFEQTSGILSRLCPCHLMSPISAAQYLDPAREPFDLVVFDEASQMPTSSAIGVLARAKDAVIVGDPKQMPPTSFFATKNKDEESVEIEDLESILDDCLALSMPSAHLSCHYRSAHESLISFSNREFYDSRLVTFPTPDARQSHVRFVKVDGFYDRGGNRQNRAEGQAIVDEVVRRLNENPYQSLGIVTFSIVQQNYIDDLLNSYFAQHPEIEKVALDRDEPLFVKNLENVQGDERDVILFSICYGPDEKGNISMNFGPINRDGGWRRLNVAITRAREEMVVFSSITADQIDLNRTRSEGVENLKNFLEFAEKGMGFAMRRAETQRDELTESIADALRERGYQVQTSVGCSHYRVDIGICGIDSSFGDGKSFILGIVLDGLSYDSAPTVHDREIGNFEVLKHLGWKLMRVYAIDWWENREGVLMDIERLVRSEKELGACPECGMQNSELNEDVDREG